MSIVGCLLSRIFVSIIVEDKLFIAGHVWLNVLQMEGKCCLDIRIIARQSL